MARRSRLSSHLTTDFDIPIATSDPVPSPTSSLRRSARLRKSPQNNLRRRSPPLTTPQRRPTRLDKGKGVDRPQHPDPQSTLPLPRRSTRTRGNFIDPVNDIHPSSNEPPSPPVPTEQHTHFYTTEDGLIYRYPPENPYDTEWLEEMTVPLEYSASDLDAVMQEFGMNVRILLADLSINQLETWSLARKYRELLDHIEEVAGTELEEYLVSQAARYHIPQADDDETVYQRLPAMGSVDVDDEDGPTGLAGQSSSPLSSPTTHASVRVQKRRRDAEEITQNKKLRALLADDPVPRRQPIPISSPLPPSSPIPTERSLSSEISRSRTYTTHVELERGPFVQRTEPEVGPSVQPVPRPLSPIRCAPLDMYPDVYWRQVAAAGVSPPACEWPRPIPPRSSEGDIKMAWSPEAETAEDKDVQNATAEESMFISANASMSSGQALGRHRRRASSELFSAPEQENMAMIKAILTERLGWSGEMCI